MNTFKVWEKDRILVVLEFFIIINRFRAEVHTLSRARTKLCNLTLFWRADPSKRESNP